MTKITATLLSACLGMAAGQVGAQDAMSHNNMKPDVGASDGMRNDASAHALEASRSDAMSHDAMKADPTVKGGAQRERAAKGAMKKSPASHDAMKHGAPAHDALDAPAMKK